ncbi:golgi apparatus membrane protein Tvp23p [[Candida] anglica]|uniref:Golgi apparatus membrane protein TVP23 n=1 Tax=[Candida] anglica TaxID=148631 RepID=A0ABP0EAG2_9ASCO
MSNYTPIESDVASTTTAPPSYREQENVGGATTTTTNSAPVVTSQDPNDWSWVRKIKESSHPLALTVYIILRLGPIFMYLFGTLFIGLFTKDNKFILHFIFIVLLISADFWNLKNVAGRLLVGLRWWNETNFSTEGATAGEVENVWVFETANPDRYINPIDSKMFWLLLYVQPVLWGVLGILAVLKFQFLYLVLIVIAVSLSATNAVAFTKCDRFSKANGLATDLFSRATSNVFARINPFSQ